MNQSIEHVKEALIEAISKTMENMAFEQVELIEGDQELQANEVPQELPPEVRELLGEGDDTEGDSEDTAAEDETEQNDNGMLWTTIPILKPYRGELILIFTSGYAQALTEAIYGDMDEIDCSSSPTVLDAVAEVINTIAGRFLDNLIPANEEFELGLPNTGEGDPPISEKEVVNLKFDLGGDILSAVICGRDFEALEDNEKIKETIS